MKGTTLQTARAIRDGAIDAMDALDWLLSEVGAAQTTEQDRQLKKAIALSMDAILTNIVNPLIQEHPDLGDDEDSWADVAIEHTRRRLESREEAKGQAEVAEQALPDFAELLARKKSEPPPKGG